MKWVSQRGVGFTYFNTYVNESNGLVLGWVARTSTTAPYQVYFFDARTVAGLVWSSRGTAQHALWAVEGAVKDLNVTIGIYQQDIPKLTVQIVAAQQMRKGHQ